MGGPLYLSLRITITNSKPIWAMGANNLAEFMSAQSLLKLALEKGAHSLQIYEDMMPIIKYKAMNEQYTVLLYKHWQSN
jgi:hypothetical protein